MPSWWQRDLLLRKRFDFVANDIDSTNEGCYDWIKVGKAWSTHRSSDAFNSSTPSLYASPSSWWAKQWMLVVFPIPGNPYRRVIRSALGNEHHNHTDIIIWGQFPSLAMTFSRSMVSELPTTSTNLSGRYFSTLITGFSKDIKESWKSSHHGNS